MLEAVGKFKRFWIEFLALVLVSFLGSSDMCANTVEKVQFDSPLLDGSHVSVKIAGTLSSSCDDWLEFGYHLDQTDEREYNLSLFLNSVSDSNHCESDMELDRRFALDGDFKEAIYRVHVYLNGEHQFSQDYQFPEDIHVYTVDSIVDPDFGSLICLPKLFGFCQKEIF